MAVTYAWKIDSQLYAYIVNPNCLDDNGQLKPVKDYMGSDSAERVNAYKAEYQGYVTPTPLSDIDDKKVQMYCTSKFYVANVYTVDNYAKHFDSMLEKVQSYEDGFYDWVDLKKAEDYFNIDSDCGKLTGEQGQPAIIDAVNVDFSSSTLFSSITFDFQITTDGVKYEKYTYTQLQDIFTEEVLSGIPWTPININMPEDELQEMAHNVNSPEFVQQGNAYYIKKDTDLYANKYAINLLLHMPSFESYALSSDTYNAIQRVDNRFNDYATSADTVLAIDKVNVRFDNYATSADTALAIDKVDARFDDYATSADTMAAIEAAKDKRVDVLIGDDADTSIRDIAKNELQTIIDGAPDTLDTLKEIADWISGHSGTTIDILSDIATIKQDIANLADNDAITGLQTQIDTLNEDFSNLVGVVKNAQEGDLVIIRPTDNWEITITFQDNNN